MRVLFFIYLLFPGLIWPVANMAQTITVSDNFNDGDFANAPAWSGDTSNFTILEDNANNRLRLDAPDAGSSFLSTASETAFGSWSFYVRLDFSPSGSNNLKVFLISDRPDLGNNANGYAVIAGESGSNDVFRLVRYEEGSVARTILSGTTDISNGGEFQVTVERSNDGEWTLSVSAEYGSNPIQEGNGFDDTLISPNYFGFLTNYTSSRTDLFYFDDIIVTRSPIAISAIKSISNQEFDIHFTQNPAPSSVTPSDFSINNGVGFPNTVSVEDNIATIIYPDALSGGSYTLTIVDVYDETGNSIPPNSTISFTLFDPFVPGDIIINEFSYTEPSGLSEYIELKNTTSKTFSLSEWVIADVNSQSVIGGESLVMGAYEFIVISSDTTTLFNTFGNRNYVMSNLPVLNNSGDTIQLLTESGILADSLSYTTDWDGQNAALERRSSTTPSFYKENWHKSPDARGGTPGLPNEVSQDNTPPILTGIEVISNQRLKLVFSEQLESVSATDKTNYSISNSDVKAVLFNNSNIVELTLDITLKNNDEYILTTSGVEDIFGNPSNSTDAFTYHKISAVNPGDVFINEFNFAPISGSTEYVEIYNSTSKSFNLQDWTISDNRGVRSSITTSYSILPPKSFAVLAPDNTLYIDFPDILLFSLSNFPALNNGGDQILLRDKNSILLDSLQYETSWGGDEIALERRTVEVAGTHRENWGNAPNGFGTPGSPNKIEADKKEPVLEELYAPDASTLQLIFSESLSPASATDINNYQISPTNKIRLIIANKDSVKLYLSEPMNSGDTYSVRVSNISDIFGNTLPSAQHTIEFIYVEQAEPGDLIINEISYKQDPDTGAEFIEIYNISNKNINLDGWSIGDATGSTLLTADLQLLHNSYLVFTNSQSFADQFSHTHYIPGFPSLNNSGDAIYIQNASETTIDSLRYSSSWGGDVAGTSLERKDPLAASNDASNWQTGTAPSGSTPGTQNAGFQEDQKSPELIFSKRLADGTIEVYFNEFIKLTSLTQFSSGSEELNIIKFNPVNGNRITLSPSPTKQKTVSPSIVASNLSDVKGNTTETGEIPIAEPLQVGDLVINEIMYNPLSDNQDNRPDQSEYVELRNTKNHAVSLEGIQLHDAPDENGNLRKLSPVTTNAKWLPAEGIALIYADQNTPFQNSKVAEFFKLEEATPPSTIRIDRSTLSLASTGDAIYLSDSTGTTIDSVYYDESWQNPNILDTRGIALERIAPLGPSNISSNWGSSINPKGGTPAAENSIYQSLGSAPSNVGISFTPNPFTPDNDGEKDYLLINYKLNHQDYLINAHIYDRYGRHIRELADSKPAGFRGQLIWDGRKDDRSRNRIGIYIVVFEAYGSSTGSNQAFKKTVVLARKLY